MLPFPIPFPIFPFTIPDAVLCIHYELEIFGKGRGEENLNSVILPDISIPLAHLSFWLTWRLTRKGDVEVSFIVEEVEGYGDGGEFSGAQGGEERYYA